MVRNFTIAARRCTKSHELQLVGESALPKAYAEIQGLVVTCDNCGAEIRNYRNPRLRDPFSNCEECGYDLCIGCTAAGDVGFRERHEHKPQSTQQVWERPPAAYVMDPYALQGSSPYYQARHPMRPLGYDDFSGVHHEAHR